MIRIDDLNADGELNIRDMNGINGGAGTSASAKTSTADAAAKKKAAAAKKAEEAAAAAAEKRRKAEAIVPKAVTTVETGAKRNTEDSLGFQRTDGRKGVAVSLDIDTIEGSGLAQARSYATKGASTYATGRNAGKYGTYYDYYYNQYTDKNDWTRGAKKSAIEDVIGLDLDGNGKLQMNQAGQRQGVDFGNTRVSLATGSDGLLAIDLNKNGKFDGVGELVSGESRTGRTSLTELDSNGDGALTAADTRFTMLKIVQAENSKLVSTCTGKTYAGGTKAYMDSLGRRGIESLDLSALRKRAQVTDDGGRTGAAERTALGERKAKDEKPLVANTRK